MNASIRTTRYQELGYTNDGQSLWRIVDTTDDRESRVGPHYKTKTELLADLDRYAHFYGCDGEQRSDFDPRAEPPHMPLGYDTVRPLSFRVWGCDPAYQEDVTPWRCSAAFRYLLEALDYIAYCQDAGHDVVFESPAETKKIKSTDRRVVFRPNVHITQQSVI